MTPTIASSSSRRPCRARPCRMRRRPAVQAIAGEAPSLNRLGDLDRLARARASPSYSPAASSRSDRDEQTAALDAVTPSRSMRRCARPNQPPAGPSSPRVASVIPSQHALTRGAQILHRRRCAAWWIRSSTARYSSIRPIIDAGRGQQIEVRRRQRIGAVSCGQRRIGVEPGPPLNEVRPRSSSCEASTTSPRYATTARACGCSSPRTPRGRGCSCSVRSTSPRPSRSRARSWATG